MVVLRRRLLQHRRELLRGEVAQGGDHLSDLLRWALRSGVDLLASTTASEGGVARRGTQRGRGRERAQFHTLRRRHRARDLDVLLWPFQQREELQGEELLWTMVVVAAIAQASPRARGP